MEEVREATAELLAEKPQLRSALEEILALDEEGPWEFDDLSISSGEFGEIVSRGIVEKHDGKYRVADPTAVRGVLEGNVGERSGERIDDRSFSFSLPDWDARVVATFALSLLFVALVRIVLIYGRVFRNGVIVPIGNDPYRRLYYVETLLESDLPAFSIGTLARLPEAIQTGDATMVIANWWVASLIGGDHAAQLTIVWYPVVAALLSAVFVYLLTKRLTDDYRAGLAAVVLLAVTPAHAYRTALGFGDHHAFDYLWLSLTTLAVVYLIQETPHDRGRPTPATWSGWTWITTVVLGVALSVQTSAWTGGPLLLVPLGLFVTFKAAMDRRAGRSPLVANAPLLVGLAIAGALTPLTMGWLPPYRLFAPALLCIGALLVLGIAELAGRVNISPRATLLAETGVASICVIVVFVFVPPLNETVTQFGTYLTETSTTGIAETASLFSGQLGTLVGPLLILGFVLYLAIPGMVWETIRCSREDRPDWLVPVVYAWYLFGFAVVQLRFAGVLSLFVAVFAGVGFVQLAAKVEVARPFGSGTVTDATDGGTAQTGVEFLIPEPRQIVALLALFALVGGLGVLQSYVKMDQLAIDDSTYETATKIDHIAERQGLTYPENYVFSEWGRNRVYNYFVSGEAETYWYAQQTYIPFLRSTQSDGWYDEFEGRVGFVVTTNFDMPAETMHSRLHDRFGSTTGDVPGLGHYRAVYVSENGRQKAFQVVPGARITGSSKPNDTIEIETSVTVNGTQFTYRRLAETNGYGDYSVIVPYEGRYNVNGTARSVDNQAIDRGETVGTYLAHFTFQERSGDRTVDTVGGTTGRITGAEWRDYGDGALSFTAERRDHVRLNASAIDLTGSNAFTVCTVARPTATDAGTQDVVNLGGFEVVLAWESDERAWQIYFQNRTGQAGLTEPSERSVGNWSHVCGRYDGTELSLWVDGTEIATRPASGVVRNESATDGIGSSGRNSRFFQGQIADVRVYNRSLSGSAIRTNGRRFESVN